jgi:hypothetical protein
MPLPYRRGAERIIRYLTGKFVLGGVLPNDGYLTGVPKTIFRKYLEADKVGNAGGGTDDLQSFTLPAHSLKTDGDRLSQAVAGSFATNDNDKRIQILVDGQTVEDFGAFDFDAGEWVAYANYIRETSTILRVDYMAMYGTPLVINDSAFTSGTQDIIYLPRIRRLTVSNMDTNDLVFKVTGTATANDDIVQSMTWIELTRF